MSSLVRELDVLDRGYALIFRGREATYLGAIFSQHYPQLTSFSAGRGEGFSSHCFE
ncbi:hypothetical protein PHO31112_04931 [Pandoraea horticolens]|uniref:Uncharacterized protein n=1 Tax=Pandoraea horticolens TaxID=2508298 RepID=A0A5E4Z1D0_9BURK|nr:hypothetical protein [Pandoraea horticolens]VVE54487.1 hypothetical protein PHO31112_04931 [Pandoraea horticolens]